MKTELRIFSRAIIAAIGLTIVGCASNSKKEEPEDLIPDTVASVSIDCNVETYVDAGRSIIMPWDGRPIDLAWNSDACRVLESQMVAYLHRERISKSAPLIVTLALASADRYQENTTPQSKSWEQSAAAYAKMKPVLPMIMTPSYQPVFDETKALVNSNSKALADDKSGGTESWKRTMKFPVLWTKSLKTSKEELHLQVSLYGFYNPPNGVHENIAMVVTFTTGDGCRVGYGGWMFKFTQGEMDSDEIIDRLPWALRWSLSNAMDGYERWQKGESGTCHT